MELRQGVVARLTTSSGSSSQPLKWGGNLPKRSADQTTAATRRAARCTRLGIANSRRQPHSPNAPGRFISPVHRALGLRREPEAPLFVVSVAV